MPEIDPEVDPREVGIFPRYMRRRHEPEGVQQLIVNGAFSNDPEAEHSMDVFDPPKLDDGGLQIPRREHFKHFDWELESNEKYWRGLLVEVGAGEWPHELPDDADDWAKDLSILLRMAKALRRYIKRRDFSASVYVAYHLGLTQQRFGVRWAERHVLHSKKILRKRDEAVSARGKKAQKRLKFVLAKAKEIGLNGSIKRETLAQRISEEYLKATGEKFSADRIEKLLQKHRPKRKKPQKRAR